MWSTADRGAALIPSSDRRAYLVSRLGLLVALGLVLQILEGMLPPILPLPGAKLGLANLATLVALFSMGPWEALAVNFLRCLLGGLLRGSFVGLTISLSAGTAATLVMILIYLARPPGITLTGMSIAGAVSHNAAQLGVAIWLVGFSGLRYYLPYLLLLAVPTGFFIGISARRLLLSLGAASSPASAVIAAVGDESMPQGHAVQAHSENAIQCEITAPEGNRGEPVARVAVRVHRSCPGVDLPERRSPALPGIDLSVKPVPSGDFPATSPDIVPASPSGRWRRAVVILENVHLHFPGREDTPALRDISLSVSEGEFLIVTGLNGSGKSTLCKLLNGLLLPSRGRVLIHGLDTARPDNLPLIRRRVGLVMQNPDHQVVASTVEEDVAFGPENLGLPREEIEDRVEEALRLVNITYLRRRQPHLLSLGEKKRVALAGVLAMRPRILVTDEVTSMLDPTGRKEMMDLLLRLREKTGVTLVHVTHRPEEFYFADRLILLEEGCLIYEGLPEDFSNDFSMWSRIKTRPPEVLVLVRELRKRGWWIPENPLDAEEVVEGLWASL